MQEPLQKPLKQPDPTKERILEEAEKLFAQKGFDGVSVREITQAAGAHLAAINYHFGSKKGLYLEVFRSRWLPRGQKMLAKLHKLDSQDNVPLEKIIRTLAEGFINKSISDEEAMHHHQLFAREMVRRSEAFDMILAEATKPLFTVLCSLLGKALKLEPFANETTLAALSVFAQVVFFNASRPLARMSIGWNLEENYLDRVVDHIVTFSLNGLQGTKAQEAGS